MVLDPFCGCGTAVAAAQKLGRQWMGIDITHLAVALMKKPAQDRLRPGAGARLPGGGGTGGRWQRAGAVGAGPLPVPVLGRLPAGGPTPVRAAAGRRPGIDGLLYFIDGPRRTSHKIVVQVKGGRVSSPQVRDLKGVVEREQAALGLFISLDEPTRDMRTEAASGGLYHSDIWQKDYPKIQLRTIAELLEGKGFEIPPHPPTLQAAPRVRRAEGRQSTLGEAG